MSCIHHETFPQFLLRTAIVGIVCCALVAVIEIVWTFGYWIYKRLAGK
jgi:hypothetical protein